MSCLACHHFFFHEPNPDANTRRPGTRTFAQSRINEAGRTKFVNNHAHVVTFVATAKLCTMEGIWHNWLEPTQVNEERVHFTQKGLGDQNQSETFSPWGCATQLNNIASVIILQSRPVTRHSEIIVERWYFIDKVLNKFIRPPASVRFIIIVYRRSNLTAVVIIQIIFYVSVMANTPVCWSSLTKKYFYC